MYLLLQLQKRKTGDPLKQLKESCHHGRIPSESLSSCEMATDLLPSTNQLAIAISLLQLPIGPAEYNVQGISGIICIFFTSKQIKHVHKILLLGLQEKDYQINLLTKQSKILPLHLHLVLFFRFRTEQVSSLRCFKSTEKLL